MHSRYDPPPLTSTPLCDRLSFLFHDTAPTEIYTLSLHDALPISGHHHRAVLHHRHAAGRAARVARRPALDATAHAAPVGAPRHSLLPPRPDPHVPARVQGSAPADVRRLHRRRLSWADAGLRR